MESDSLFRRFYIISDFIEPNVEFLNILILLFPKIV